MPWQRIILTAQQINNREHERLKQVFNALFLAAGMPPDMFLLARPRPDGSTEYYFSPLAGHYARELIRAYESSACPEPEVTQVILAGGLQGT